MSAFAKLQLEDVRDHWAHEEHDFSKWVVDEIDVGIPEQDRTPTHVQGEPSN